MRLFGITFIFCSEKVQFTPPAFLLFPPRATHYPIPESGKSAAVVYNFSTFFIEIIEGHAIFLGGGGGGKGLSHKIHGNTKFKGILIWLFHTVSSCLFTLCKTPVLSIKMAASNFFPIPSETEWRYLLIKWWL